MTAKYNMEEGMALMKEQMPDVMSAFGALMEQVTQDGLLPPKPSDS